ncbi:Splicing factor U2af large subunit B [Monoraphidium neglectum]|uniref:Splicing factor U2af large subunit B n=1 Tax=Monoraphidium neglectum TaxID=145388 RepID=A0A0D2N6Q7_9CHLO|nr:Splicing factor U2af large subunit B [Monoraphidium neglectum]KIZ01571.1 Splicing factor U2af large subunit B [Monoraphidium neglectum]|eukprot:XP_013900590.1 Splicing factor U2af large subunit B [Monoraphidium neglectum]
MSDPAEMARIWQEQMLKSRQLIIQQQAKSAAQAAAKSQRELYIGNLAAGMVTADALRQVFDSALMAAYPESALPGAAPVVNCNVHKDGKYGFVEFRTPEYATAALQLNGSVHLMGTTISIGRPAAYIDPNKVAVAAQQAELQIAMQRAGIAPGAAASAVIGALPPPPLIPGVLPPPPVLPGVAPPAPPPGGPPPPGAAAVSVPGVAAAAGNLGYNLASEPGYSVLPTRFVAVAGMVTAEVLADNDEYEDVVEDLRDECRRHGRVAGIKVPRPANPADSASLMYSGPYGKAYVEFEGPEGAQAAKDAIHGRVFAGNLVQAVFITPEAFEVVPSK